MRHKYGVLLTPDDMFVLDETNNLSYAQTCAREYRNDGYQHAFVVRFCTGCNEWRRDYFGRCCRECSGSILTNARGAVAFGGTIRDPDSIMVK